MDQVTEKEKKSLMNKFHEFQKSGLEAYGKYLQEQLDYASKSDSRKAYKKYIEDQIAMNTSKIEELQSKLS